MQPSRRVVLVAGAVCVSAACRRTPTKPVVVDPDVALQRAALEREQELVGTFTAVIAARPALSARLTPLLADHTTHVTTLGGVPETTQISVPAGDLVHALLLLERSAATAHGQAAVTASRRLAPLLASLAASCSAAAVVL